MTAKLWKSILPVLTAAALVLPAAGCKTDAARVCDRLEELMTADGEADQYQEQACKDHVNELAEECTNFDELVACWVEAEDSRAFGSCRSQCVRE